MTAYKKVFEEYKNDKGEVEYRHLQTILSKLKHDPTETEMESVYEHLDTYGKCKYLFMRLMDTNGKWGLSINEGLDTSGK